METQEFINKMDNSIKHFEKELQTIRTSRASPSMLENIFVDAYGSKTAINQLGNISAPDSSLLTIQVWDTSLLKNIENAILESNLGINPQVDGALIRLPIPKLSEERRKELTKIASQYAESSKISIRNSTSAAAYFNWDSDSGLRNQLVLLSLLLRVTPIFSSTKD